MSYLSVSRAGRSVFHLTAKDDEIVLALTRKIRVASLSQLARTWWRDSPLGRESALRRANRLVQAGVLDAFVLRAHPELPLEAPIWCWTPGEVPPQFGALSYRLRCRWTEPLRPVSVYVASVRAARLYAGFGGPPKHALQVTHDLHVTALYLRLFLEAPLDAERWISENALAVRRQGQKVPDAEIHDGTGRTLKVIEFGGSYASERVQKVHEDCERRGVPYELW